MNSLPVFVGQNKPPGKGPALRQGKREPSHPEALGNGNYSQVGVP